MRVAFSILLGIFLSAACFLVMAQTDKNEDDEVLRIDTQLIDVPIIVTDKAGKPLLNLKQTNFILFEDGKRQEITEFAATTAPFEVALLLDTSGSTRSDLVLIRRAAESFISSLRPGDRVAIIAYKTDRVDGRSIAASDVLLGLSDDREALTSALDRAATSNGTPYYDSLLQVVNSVFKQKPADQFRGRRALVALTDGVDSTSKAEFDEAKKSLESAGVISYFVKVNTRDFFEANVLGDCNSPLRFSQAQIRRYYDKFYPRAKGERATDFCQIGEFERLDISKKLYQLADMEMSELARVSGGRVFPIVDLNGAKSAFDKVAQEIGTKYSLGYYSDNDTHNGAFRRIRVELKGLPPGSIIRAREGYTAEKK